MIKPYLYLEGLHKLSTELRGDERIHVGIRPYGFHAGNALALIAYPYLICERTKQKGKEPKFHFIVSINDYEQDKLDGPDPVTYPFNIHPTETSIQWLPDEFGCCASLVDHWEKEIKKHLSFLSTNYPSIIITLVRNSSLKHHPVFQDLFFDTLLTPHEYKNIFTRCSGKPALDKPIMYGGIICPQCKTYKGQTTPGTMPMISWHCEECGTKKTQSFEHFDYWWYHKPMLVARLKIFDIDLTISGGDHFTEGDFEIRKELLLRAGVKNSPKMLFTPILFAPDGRKMSKSRNNTAAVAITKLIELAKNTPSAILHCSEHILLPEYEKDYSYFG